jgi:hypothetical protein
MRSLSIVKAFKFADCGRMTGYPHLTRQGVMFEWPTNHTESIDAAIR